MAITENSYFLTSFWVWKHTHDDWPTLSDQEFDFDPKIIFQLYFVFQTLLRVIILSDPAFTIKMVSIYVTMINCAF